MADQRLVLGLSSWLRDSDVSPPDARMSASRVMAGVDTTRRLRRFWPPARFVREVQPAAELGVYGPGGPPVRSAPRVPAPVLRARLREVVTPVRALAAAVLAALTLAVLFLGASLQSPSPPPDAAAAAAPMTSASPAPAATIVPAPTPDSTPTPSPALPSSPEPVAAWVPSDRAFDWDDGGVRLETDLLRLEVGDKVFTAVPAEVYTDGTSEPGQARLEVHWTDGSTEQQMLLDLAADDDEWWVRRVRLLDGRKKPAWVMFDVPAAQTRTPIGESFEGDLRLLNTGAQRKALREPGSATLRLDSVRLTAFDEASRP